MKLLLTSGGITNASIRSALLDLLGKPIAECSALCITTASYGLPGGPGRAWRYFTGQATMPMCELEWKSVGVLELTALPSIEKALWVPTVQETDVLLVNGGDTLYLGYWMRQSGLVDLLPSLHGVWVGLSAGSVVMTPRIGEKFIHWQPPPSVKLPNRGEMLGVVDFSIFPHVDHPALPEYTMADAEKWADDMMMPTYAIDDETAIKVVDGAVEVISEGHWRLFTPQETP